MFHYVERKDHESTIENSRGLLKHRAYFRLMLHNFNANDLVRYFRVPLVAERLGFAECINHQSSSSRYGNPPSEDKCFKEYHYF